MELAHDIITPSYGARLRQPTFSNIREDLKLVREGVMDMASFVSGYRRWQNPVQVEVHGPDGRLKAVRRTHNMRTNNGAVAQGVRMAGYGSNGTPATNLGALVTTAQPVVLGLAYEASNIPLNSADAFLGASGQPIGTAAGSTTTSEIIAAASSLTRALVDTVTWSFTPTAAGTTQLTAIYYLKKIWTAGAAQTVTKVGIFDNSTAPSDTTHTSGTLWFEFILTSAVILAPGDTLTVTYTITI